jgi:hypothetical protein
LSGTPSDPVDLEQVNLAKPVLRLTINRDEASLMALTTSALVKMRLSNPAAPSEVSRVSLFGLLFPDMKTDGLWTYLNGITTLSVWDGPNGLEKRGSHNVREWVAGRIVNDDFAYRIRRMSNTFEIWVNP